MKTIREWAEELPPRIRELFLANLDEDESERTQASLKDAVYYGFIWESSIQGHIFWDSVHNNCIYPDKFLNIPSYLLNSLPLPQEKVDKAISELKEFEKTEPDNISHPHHYTDTKIEVIEYIEDKNFGFHLGNAIKYISRAGKKDSSKKVEDIQKAIWYLERFIKIQDAQ